MFDKSKLDFSYTNINSLHHVVFKVNDSIKICRGDIKFKIIIDKRF